MLVRIALVLAVLAVLALSRPAYARWRERVAADATRPHPRVPVELLEGSDRTWLVFTTPYCAACGPVKDRLEREFPGDRVVTIDATKDPTLADAFFVRSVPTMVLADGTGEVQARLVGARGLDEFASVA